MGAGDDPAERAADRVATDVLRNLARGAGGGTPIRRGTSHRIRRSTAGDGIDSGAVTPDVERRIDRAQRSGAPLPTEVNRQMSEGFGTAFDHVRIHTDGAADQLNRDLHARAFTLGDDVFFGRDEFRPESSSGRELLAHELAHTLQPGGADTASRMIRRWDINGAIDPTTAVRVTTIRSGQAVFFLEDPAGDKLVVKGDNVPIGLNQLFATIHHQVNNTKSVVLRGLPDTARDGLKTAIAGPAAAADPSWTNLYNADSARVDARVAAAAPANTALFGAVPTDPSGKARLYHIEQIDTLPKVVAMTDAGVAGGRAIEDAMKPGAGGGAAGGPKTARAMFGDPKHMEQLGIITAADLFLGNGDRVKAGNFGNWFVDANGAITLIDNLDPQASGELRYDDAIPEDTKLLRKTALRQTATDAVATLVRGMVTAGDTTAPDWAATSVKGKVRSRLMEEAFLAGLKTGKARIVKLYASNKMGRAGRAAKQAAQATQAQDVARGDNTQRDYWETLKARARWLQAN